MPDQNPDAQGNLRKLAERLRQGAPKHPMPERSLDTVRNAVRDEWEIEQHPKPRKVSPTTQADRGPSEPDQDR